MRAFLDAYQDRKESYTASGLKDFCRWYPKTRVHSVSLASLFGYYDLYNHHVKNEVHFFKGLVVLPARKKMRAILYDPTQKYDFGLITTKLEVICEKELEMPGFVKSKTDELVYNLQTVFDRSSYHSAKDWTRSVSYPLNLSDRLEFNSSALGLGNLEIARQIHSEWVQMKLADPTVFQMTFGGAKYWRLIEDYIRVYQEFFPGHVRLGYLGEKPFSVECDYLIDDTAFAMSSFDLHWKDEFPSNISNGVRLRFLKELWERGVQTFNYGFSLNARLKGFKSHWPYETVIVYRYIKEETPQSKSVLDL